jgi:hypothetical protein
MAILYQHAGWLPLAMAFETRNIIRGTQVFECRGRPYILQRRKPAEFETLWPGETIGAIGRELNSGPASD